LKLMVIICNDLSQSMGEGRCAVVNILRFWG
jgi:hypothetical protein